MSAAPASPPRPRVRSCAPGSNGCPRAEAAAGAARKKADQAPGTGSGTPPSGVVGCRLSCVRLCQPRVKPA
jgi:hypothetical protein